MILHYIYIPDFLYSSAHRHLGGFHMLAIVNNDAVSIRMQLSLHDIDFNFFGHSEMGLLDHMRTLFLIF